jgi:hypothetical protein
MGCASSSEAGDGQRDLTVMPSAMRPDPSPATHAPRRLARAGSAPHVAALASPPQSRRAMRISRSSPQIHDAVGSPGPERPLHAMHSGTSPACLSSSSASGTRVCPAPSASGHGRRPLPSASNPFRSPPAATTASSQQLLASSPTTTTPTSVVFAGQSTPRNASIAASRSCTGALTPRTPLYDAQAFQRVLATIANSSRGGDDAV